MDTIADEELRWCCEHDVRDFLSPGMGTEVMAQVLHSVVRFTRPAVTLEIGAGFTTMAILRALKLQ